MRDDWYDERKDCQEKRWERKKSQKGQYVFTKDGVYFALDRQQMAELVELVSGLQDGRLEKIVPSDQDVVVED